MFFTPFFPIFSNKKVALDPGLVKHRKDLIVEAARALDGAKMMRFDERSGNLYVTELGRVASHFYIQYRSVQTYNEILKRHMSDVEVDPLNLSNHFNNFSPTVNPIDFMNFIPAYRHGGALV